MYCFQRDNRFCFYYLLALVLGKMREQINFVILFYKNDDHKT